MRGVVCVRVAVEVRDVSGRVEQQWGGQCVRVGAAVRVHSSGVAVVGSGVVVAVCGELLKNNNSSNNSGVVVRVEGRQAAVVAVLDNITTTTTNDSERWCSNSSHVVLALLSWTEPTELQQQQQHHNDHHYHLLEQWGLWHVAPSFGLLRVPCAVAAVSWPWLLVDALLLPAGQGGLLRLNNSNNNNNNNNNNDDDYDSVAIALSSLSVEGSLAPFTLCLMMSHLITLPAVRALVSWPQHVLSALPSSSHDTPVSAPLLLPWQSALLAAGNGRVARLQCGTRWGTAFYVGHRRWATCRHVVGDCAAGTLQGRPCRVEWVCRGSLDCATIIEEESNDIALRNRPALPICRCGERDWGLVSAQCSDWAGPPHHQLGVVRASAVGSLDAACVAVSTSSVSGSSGAPLLCQKEGALCAYLVSTPSAGLGAGAAATTPSRMLSLALCVPVRLISCLFDARPNFKLLDAHDPAVEALFALDSRPPPGSSFQKFIRSKL